MYSIMPNFISKFNILEEKHRAFINLIIKPLMSLIIFLSVGYYTMWLSTNYVRQDKFFDFVEKQTKADEQQDDSSKARFEVTQTKLETIINQQVAYTEQIKTLNAMLLSYQKQVDELNDRILYLERNQRLYHQAP
jgi:peptidoglycan hydrolase CwlO-like protein